MMITTSNYFNEINRIGPGNLPDTFRKSHDFVLKSTANGSNWDTYHKNEVVHKVIDLYFSKLNEFIDSGKVDKEESKSTNVSVPKPPKPYPVSKKTEAAPKKTASRKNKKKAVVVDSKSSAKKVATIREEVKFIKRYVGLHNKVKSPNTILAFIKALQRSIVQKLIRKTSPLAKEIEIIQEKLVSAYNRMTGEEKIDINDKDLVRLVVIAGGEEVFPSIKLIKRFVGMQEKDLEEKQIDSFVSQLEKAVKSKKVVRDDPYANKLNSIYKKLRQRSGRRISLSQAELSGLEGIVKACCKKEKKKIQSKGFKSKVVKPRAKALSKSNQKLKAAPEGLSGVLTAEQMANRQFKMLNFNPVWCTLLGMPAKNFTMMLHGEPHNGKTTFLLKFAQYLAENFGEVLYVSSEEFASVTMTQKVNELVKPFPTSLHFAENLKDPDLSAYQFIILDSVNDLGLRVNDYKAMREAHPNTAFILILQHTKDGNFRGGKDWEHMVEIVGEVSNGVITISKNRYGPKASLDFFNQLNNDPEALRKSTIQNYSNTMIQ